MLQFEDIQLSLFGAAAILDTAVMAVLLERRNWPRVLLPLVLLIGGAWAYHVGAFFHVALFSAGPWANGLQWGSMAMMAFGLGLQPSAALHLWLRVRRSGFATRPQVSNRYLILYAPLLGMFPVAWVLWGDPRGYFTEILEPVVGPFVSWLMLANVVAGVGALALTSRFSDTSERSFLRVLGLTLVGVTLVEGFAVVIGPDLWPEKRSVLLVLGTLGPVALTLVMAYVIVRFQLMQLVLKQSVFYAALVAVVVLLHQALLRDIWASLEEALHLDAVLLESLLVLALVALVRPLRERVSEALRYLLGERVGAMRVRARELAVEMSAMFNEPAERVLQWFVAAVGPMFGVDYVAIWLLEPGVRVTARCGETSRLAEQSVLELYAQLADHQLSACQRSDAPTREVATFLAAAGASVSVALRHPSIRGVVLCGARRYHRELSDEQMGSLVMLVEQLGITLNNGLLQSQSSRAERLALQNEKLSTLGLVASSIAHEVKNPLSSIKTIASVMAEDAEPQSEQARDLQLIVEEVNRLAGSVDAILSFARPAKGQSAHTDVAAAIDGTLRVMRHVAKQHGAHIDAQVAKDLPEAAADENAVREVVFNLLANAVRAAGVGGKVVVVARENRGRVVVEVRDDGPGIAAEIQDRLFEPFVTNHDDGTGLGLYVVRRRLGDVGGSIVCDSHPDRGTVFVVEFPGAHGDGQ